MTPQNSNNVKEAGEESADSFVALRCLDKSSVDWVVDALLWFPLSRRCFLLWHRSVLSISVKIRLFRQLLVPGQSWEEGTPFRCFNRNAQCGWGKTWQAEVDIAFICAKDEEAENVTQILRIIQGEQATCPRYSVRTRLSQLFLAWFNKSSNPFAFNLWSMMSVKHS